MKYKLVALSLTLAFASTYALSAASQEKVCKVTDPTGTPLNVRNAPNGRIIGTLKNDTEVYIEQLASDDSGRPWAQISSYRRGRRRIIGWVFREFISCYNRSDGARIIPEYSIEETPVAGKTKTTLQKNTSQISLIGTTWKIYETIKGVEEWGTYTFLANGRIAEDENARWKLVGNKVNIKEEYGDIDLVIKGNKMTGSGQLGMNPRPFPMRGERIQ